MHTSLMKYRLLQTWAVALLVLAFGTTASAQKWKDKVKVKDPVKSAKRAVESVTEGDAKKSKEIASHTVGYAIDHYDMKDLISKADIDRARGDLYDFLKWEVGSPSAIAAQYTTTGYSHFERRFGDEAAASLLDVDLPGEKGKSEITLPKTIAALMKNLVDSLGAEAGAVMQSQYGIPPQVTAELVKIMSRGGKKAIDRVGLNMPKNWDIDNRLVKQLIYLRRQPAPAQASGTPKKAETSLKLR